MWQQTIGMVLLTTVLSLNARDAAAVPTEKAFNMEARIDSLHQRIRYLEEELQQIRQNTQDERSEVDELLALFNGDAVETADIESRSRHKRVDEMLKAIVQQPGQLRFNGGATAIFQGGGDRSDQYSSATSSFDIYASTAFGPNTLLFFDWEAIGGNGPDDYFPNFAGLNGDAGSTQDSLGIDRLTVLEAWAEFTMLNRIFTITAGKIDLTNYFDNNASANDETMQFISGAFVNSAAFAVPGNSPGVRLRTTLFDRFHFQTGIVSADNSGSEILKELYRIASLGFTIFPASDFESNLRLYGYQDPRADYATGWGISFDNLSFGTYNIFARYGQNSAGVAESWGVRCAWSLGIRFLRNIANQSTAMGLAYGVTTPRDDDLHNEQLLELYARRQVNKWTHLSPHLQVIWNAGGAADRIILFGVRTHFNF